MIVVVSLLGFLYRLFTHISPYEYGCLLCQMLSRLLNSSHPEDLKAANKLIKEMVQEVENLFPLPSYSFYKLHFSVTH